jgi:hypothetical protein
MTLFEDFVSSSSSGGSNGNGSGESAESVPLNNVFGSRKRNNNNKNNKNNNNGRSSYGSIRPARKREGTTKLHKVRTLYHSLVLAPCLTK